MNNIEIKGNTTQKEDVDPEKPKEIKNEVILSVIDNDGKQKQIPIDIAFNGLKEGEYFFKENGKWYLHKLEDRSESIKMMNNIEILEELKARLKLYKKSTDVQFTFTKSDIQAIENLIQENKELKKENLELHKEINQRIKLKLENERCADEDYIPKSKVKEKIKEYNIPIFDILDKLPIPRTIEEGCGAKDGIIYVLQELLEEGE